MVLSSSAEYLVYRSLRFSSRQGRLISQKLLFIGFFICLALGEMAGQNFSFFSVLQAGKAGSGTGTNEWELGILDGSNLNLTTQNFAYSAANQHWQPAAGTQTFRIGWDSVSNSAYTTVFSSTGVSTVTAVNAGTRIAANSTWTLPTATFLVSADQLSSASSVQVQSLALSSGASFTGGTLPQNFIASQSGSLSGIAAVQTNLSAPLVINPASSGGSWYVTGTIRFSGLRSQGGLAEGSNLLFLLGANSGPQAVPEAASVGLVGFGLFAIAFVRSSRSGSRKL